MFKHHFVIEVGMRIQQNETLQKLKQFCMVFLCLKIVINKKYINSYT